MSYSAPLLLRSRCFHHHAAVWSKARHLFREETSPNQRQRNSVGSSAEKSRSSKKHSKFDLNNNNKKLVRNRPNGKAKDEEDVLDKSNVNIRKRFRNTRIEIDEVTAEKMVLYKDKDIIALNKPSGIAVHSGPKMKNDLSHYLHYWQESGHELPELAHRLDKDTSGVLLLTRHTDAARRLAQLFKERGIVKKYWTVTFGVPDHLEGVIQIPLSTRNIAASGNMTRVVLRVDKMAAHNSATVGKTLPGGVAMAETEYSVLSVCSLAPKRCCLMEVTPVTGFKHQIRVHLADGLTCPILGDHKFAGPVLRASPNLKKRVEAISKTSHLHLHAREIVIPGYLASTGKPLVVKAPLPGYFIKTAKEQGLHLSVS